MSNYLITGGAGYFGSVLVNYLLKQGHNCTSIDLEKSNNQQKNLTNIVGDVSNKKTLTTLFKESNPFDAVIHCAAKLQLKFSNKKEFYATNISATEYLVDLCKSHQCNNLVYISSNCVYGKTNTLNVDENTARDPFEDYGQTKYASEKILESAMDTLNITIFRPPTIIGEKRLGILSIVFDFIRENRILWLVGSGDNRYQFVYADDLAHACLLAAQANKSGIYNIGADTPPSLSKLFSSLIDTAGSKSKIRHMPAKLIIPIMKLAHKMKLSPLGPYQYNMITKTYSGNTEKIKKELNWLPTQSNTDMLEKCYQYYSDNRENIHNDKQLKGHHKTAKLGLIRLLKWIS